MFPRRAKSPLGLHAEFLNDTKFHVFVHTHILDNDKKNHLI